MEGMKKSYLYMGLAEGVVGMRTFACWCHACMQAVGRGEGSLDTNLLCSACVSPHLIWHERSCARTDALGVANSRAKAQGHARKLATQLKRSLESDIRRVLIAVQNRGEDDQDQYPPFRSHLPGPSHLPPLASVVVALSAAPPSHRYWLGWATRVVKTHTSSGTVPGTRVRYDAGDLEIEIEWLQRDVSGDDERRTFQLDGAAGGVSRAAASGPGRRRAARCGGARTPHCGGCVRCGEAAAARSEPGGSPGGGGAASPAVVHALGGGRERDP